MYSLLFLWINGQEISWLESIAPWKSTERQKLFCCLSFHSLRGTPIIACHTIPMRPPCNCLGIAWAAHDHKVCGITLASFHKYLKWWPVMQYRPGANYSCYMVVRAPCKKQNGYYRQQEPIQSLVANLECSLPCAEVGKIIFHPQNESATSIRSVPSKATPFNNEKNAWLIHEPV